LVPDGSLGVERSVIQKINELSDRIDGGAARGANLFHSFQEFNVGQGRSVYFANPVQIQNILSRVTGGNASNILGRLGVLGSANLFLINPNGIIFGPNASLDIQGSFFATTADGIRLGDKGFFSATELGKSDLLSVSPGTLFFNQAASQAGNIINRGNLAVGGDLTLAAGSLDLQGQLLSGGNLTLQALDGVKIRDTVESPFVAAAAGDLLIQGNNIDIFTLNNPQSALVSYGNLTLKSPNPVIGDAHYWSGGNFRIETLDNNLGELQSIKDPVIRTGGDVFIGAYEGASLHIIAGGSVTIPGFILITGADPQFGLQETITLSNGQQIQIDGKNNPTVDIRAGVREDAIGIPFFQGSGFDIFYPPTLPPTPPSSADINLGTIFFSRNPNDGTQKITGDVLLTNQYQPNLDLQGNISVANSHPNFGFTAIDTASFAYGGRVIIDSRNNINMTGFINAQSALQGGDVLFNSIGDIFITNAVISVRSGDGGSILANANNINISNSTLLAGIGSSLGFEDAQIGDIRLNATNNILINNSFITNLVEQNGLGNAGNISINSSNFTLDNGGRVSAITFGRGNTGKIKINASNRVSISGESSNGISALVSQVGSTAKGSTGGVTINTSNFILENGARIDADTFGIGNVGAIQINASDSVIISGESLLTGFPSGIGNNIRMGGQGNTGGITINTSDFILENGAFISASVIGEGDVGTIEIKAKEDIAIRGESLGGSVSFISSELAKAGVGNLQGIILNTSNFTLANGASISASIGGKGTAEAIQINASDSANIRGESSMGNVSAVTIQVADTGIGDSGGIVIETSNFSLENGARVDASTFGFGNAGEINITGHNNVTITGESSAGKVSDISSGVGLTGIGNSGGIVINTSTFTLERGATIMASTFGSGNAGTIQIKGSDSVTITGESSIGRRPPSGIYSQVNGVGDTQKEINSGGIIIETFNFTLDKGGVIDASTFTSGNAGAIQIKATNGAIISGESLSSQNISQISSQVNGTAVGNSGGIVIDTSTFRIENGALISTSMLGLGTAGAIDIKTSTLTIEDGSSVTASTAGFGNAGAINITASERLTIQGVSLLNGNQSVISSEVTNTGVGDSGGILIDTSTLIVENGGFITASTLGFGNTGAIDITASDSIIIRGESVLTGDTSGIGNQVTQTAVGNSQGITINTSNLTLEKGGRIDSSTFGFGNAGDINLNISDNLIVKDISLMLGISSFISTQVAETGVGNAGKIIINSSNVILENGAGISASTSGFGDAGEINIYASDAVVIKGESLLTGERSAIASQVTQTGIGDSDGIMIDTSNLTIENGGLIDSSTFGFGNAGKITLSARENIIIKNEPSKSSTSSVGSTVQATGVGNSGGVIINTPNLTTEDGSLISTSTFGFGNAGDIDINASQQTSISGFIFNEIANSRLGGILAVTTGTGKAGNITINTPQLTISDGAGIEAFTQGEGTAGNITINAPDSIILNSDTKLIVETSDAGTAGNININTPLLTIGENAQLSATATATSTAPTAGNINLNVNQLNISGELGIFAETNSTPTAGSLTIHPYENNPNLNIQFTENGFISARTTNIGDGGSISLTAPENIDISGLGSITAETSGIGNAGNINITTENLTIRDGVEIRANTSSVGDSGNIILSVLNLNIDNATIEALTTNQGNPGSILITNGENQANQVNIANNSTISTEIRGEGNPETAQPANITINSENLSLISSQITASTTSNRDAGNINLNNNQINLDNGRITAITSGSGKGGNISIPNTQTLNLINNSGIIALTSGAGEAGNLNFNISESVTIDSGSFFNVETEAGGKAGQIIITSPVLTIGDNAELSARSQANATGEAGNITLTTNQLNISGELGIFAETESIANAGNLIINPLNNNPNLIINFFNKGKISASTLGDGDGGDINITASEIINISGNGSIQVEANSSGDAGEIFINANNQINLSNGVNVSSLTSGNGKAGNINLTSENLNLTEGVTITASTTGDGDAGSINLSANNLNFNQTEINAVTNSTGNAGNILINYQQENANNLTLTNSTISTEIQADGIANQPSNITIKTDNLNSENSTITASTRGKGNAGNIAIVDTENINLNNSNIIATTSGEGNTGEIELTANNTLRLNHSQISSSVEENAIGNSQQITLNTPNLSLNQSNILAETAGQGNAGSIIAPNANIINLNNSTISTAIAPTGIATQPSNITLNTEKLTLDNNSRITASTEGKGNAGNITVPNAQTISLDNNSQINASTSGEGNAGDIALNAQTVTLNNSSAITTTVNPNAIGRGGNITLQTTGNSLTLNNQSQISSRSQGQGNAGDILINSAGNVTLTNSDISTSAEQASGGAITITARNLQLNGDSNLRTNVASGAGGGGNILLTADSILAFGDSDILAFARDGKGGNITFNTPIFFAEGFQPIPQDPNSLNGNNRVDINASGAISGIITSPDLSFIRNSLIDLPENLIDIENLIANSCVVPNRQKAGTFVITGSGGLPTRPGDASMSSYSTGTVRAIPDKSASSQSWQPGNPIIEPQSVYRLSNGKLVLSRECQ
jgi:filamentous hemagglutinin family protein